MDYETVIFEREFRKQRWDAVTDLVYQWGQKPGGEGPGPGYCAKLECRKTIEAALDKLARYAERRKLYEELQAEFANFVA